MRRLLCSAAVIGLLLPLAGTLEAQDGAPPDIPAPARVFYGLTPQFAVAPDASQVVFVADAPAGPAMLWLRPLRGGTARPLAGTTQSSYPFWSADSKFIGFFAAGKLQKVPATGGSPVAVCDAPNGRGGTWNTSDVIVFTSGMSDPLRQVPARAASRFLRVSSIPRARTLIAFRSSCPTASISSIGRAQAVRRRR